MVTHGFNIKLAFGAAVDEGYCMILKPSDTEPSNKQTNSKITKDYTLVAKAFKDAVHQRVLDETGSERRERDLKVDFCFLFFLIFVFVFVGGRFYDVMYV